MKTSMTPFVSLFICMLLLIEVKIVMTEEKTFSPYATMYVYSGRPNPKWELSFEEWQQLTQLIDSLTKISETTDGPYQFQGHLGYSGFLAHFSIISSYPYIYYLANERQTILSNSGGYIIFNDQDQIIEKWFENSAKHHQIQLPSTI